MTAAIVMYRTRWCPYCVLAKKLLTAKGVPFTEVDVSGSSERRQWLRDATGQRTVPQLFISGTPIGGFRELYQLERCGELDALLANE